jgi:hypothetical protein
MNPVELVYVGGKLYVATKENRKGAAVVLRIDPKQITDNYGFAALATAVKYYTTQNQWPPVPGGAAE